MYETERWTEVDGSKLLLFILFFYLVPSVPQDVSALRTGSTTVLVTWMEPAVSFRELSHNCNTVIPCMLHRFTVCALLCILQNFTCLSFWLLPLCAHTQHKTNSNQLPNCSMCAAIPQFNAPPLSAFSS